MANALYDKARELYLTTGLNWLTYPIKAVLVDTGTYTVNLAANQFLDHIGAGAQRSHSPAFANKTAVGGAADADDITFSSVSGVSIEAIVIYGDSGTPSTSPLIAYIDTATGLPITPNGGDIIVTFDNGPNKIFKL